MKIITSLLLLASCIFSTTSFGQDQQIFVKPTKDTTYTLELKANVKVQIKVTPTKAPKPSAMQKIVNKISLRQSLQSVKDKDEAAFVNLVFPDEGERSENFAFALAYNVIKEDSRSTLKPFIEWQRNNLSTKEQNVFLSGVNFQSTIISKENDGWPFIPYTIAAINYKHDNVKKTEGTQAKLYVSPLFLKNNSFLPESYFLKWKLLRFYYNIYDGIEYEHRNSGSVPGQEGDTWRHYFRISATFNPFSELLNDRLEVITDYTYRNNFYNTSQAEMKANKLWKFSTNLILLKKTQSKIADVKIGFERRNGVDPTVGFDDQELSTISLKVKI